MSGALACRVAIGAPPHDHPRHRSGPHLLVSVAGRVVQTGALSGADRLAAQLVVTRGGAAELDHGSRPADDLFDGGRDQGRVLLELGDRSCFLCNQKLLRLF